MVNWQTNDYYINLKDYEKETGLSIADQNRINNPFGNHSAIGLAGVSLFTGLVQLGAEKLGNGLNGTTPEDNGFDTGQRTSAIKEFGSVKIKYDKAIKAGNQAEIKKYAKELVELANANKGNPTIDNIYLKEEKTIKQHAQG